MNKPIGSRGFTHQDYNAICATSGVDCSVPVHFFMDDQILLRKDFVDYCYEYLSYKLGVTERTDMVLVWTSKEDRFPTRVYTDLHWDYVVTSRILNVFKQNFDKSEKVQY